MTAMRIAVSAGLAACVLGVLAAGCGGATTTQNVPSAAPAAQAKPKCTYRAGWQKLANRIAAAVYCPGWLPDPLEAQIGGHWNNIDAVSRDRSYLESFVWQETGAGAAGGELHVNLRGYPSRKAIPSCRAFNSNAQIPCFADPHGHVSENGIVATLYTVNQDADTWHLLLAWHHRGSLYTISQHLAPPLDYRKVVLVLKHELRSLVLVEPST
jgi:hypothetical protein